MQVLSNPYWHVLSTWCLSHPHDAFHSNDALAFMDQSWFPSDYFCIAYFYVSVTANYLHITSFFFLGLVILVCTYEALWTYRHFVDWSWVEINILKNWIGFFLLALLRYAYRCHCSDSIVSTTNNKNFGYVKILMGVTGLELHKLK